MCSLGKTTDHSEGVQRCELCPAGTRGDGDSAGFCVACSEGTLSSSDRVTCGACSPGEFVYNEESCEPCPLGTYAPVALTDACLDW